MPSALTLIVEELAKTPILWEQGVAGSNPATSTWRDSAETPQEIGGFCFISYFVILITIMPYLAIFPQAKLPQDYLLPQDLSIIFKLKSNFLYIIYGR